MSLFFTRFVQLDPDPHGSAIILPPRSGSAFRKTAGSGSAFFRQLDPDPHLEILLDPDPQKMNADPQS